MKNKSETFYLSYYNSPIGKIALGSDGHAVLLHAVWEKLADEMINYGGFPYYELYCGAKNCTLSA